MQKIKTIHRDYVYEDELIRWLCKSKGLSLIDTINNEHD